MDRVAARFGRHEPRRHAAALMLGLVSALDRKNCWTIAEHRGQSTPDGLQHLLSRAVWDADAVRDDLRRYVVDHFGDRGAVLVVDETGDLKKDTQTVGVQRQYTGTAGRIENSQVAVILAYAAPRGHALVDRALYLPRSWVNDPERCAAAGVPDGVGFATKPALVTQMITAALTAGVPASWVAGDEVYGADPGLRQGIRAAGLGNVLQVSANRRVLTGAGPIRVDAVARMLPDRAWQTRSAGSGSKGRTALLLGLDRPARRTRRRSWASSSADPPQPHHRRAGLPPLLHTATDVAVSARPGGRAAVADRGILPSRQGTDRPGPTPSPALDVLAALDNPGDARPRLPAVATAAEHRTPPPAGLIEFTVNELRRLFDAIILGARPTGASLLRWSTWRRRHQARARNSHYRRRENQ
jgi:hypothetical protein